MKFKMRVVKVVSFDFQLIFCGRSQQRKAVGTFSIHIAKLKQSTDILDVV